MYTYEIFSHTAIECPPSSSCTDISTTRLLSDFLDKYCKHPTHDLICDNWWRPGISLVYTHMHTHTSIHAYTHTHTHKHTHTCTLLATELVMTFCVLGRRWCMCVWVNVCVCVCVCVCLHACVCACMYVWLGGGRMRHTQSTTQTCWSYSWPG